MFSATAPPIEMETLTPPANAAANEADPASEVIVEMSRAVNATLAASISFVPSPSIEASTSTPIWFTDITPDPEAATPTPPAAATAAEPERTTAPIV